MFPCEIETALAEKIDFGRTKNNHWLSRMKKFCEMRLYLQRYWKVIPEKVDEKCIANLNDF